MTLEVTGGTFTFARPTVSVRRLPPETTVSRTFVPGLPRIFEVATSLGLPAIDSPATATIVSPRRRPAFLAGEAGRTSEMRSPFFVVETVTPIPENSPLEDLLN